jgi:carbonic anhydrase/acetyltransferase-like protein (isoleucine patch superfamily)
VNQPTPDKPAGDPLSIGADVTVGHQVILHGCTIEDRCLIGMGSLVMDGARLRSGVLLAAGSLVSPGKELHGGWLWAGRPAKPVRELRPEELDFFVHSAAHYAELKNAYRPG